MKTKYNLRKGISYLACCLLIDELRGRGIRYIVSRYTTNLGVRYNVEWRS